MKFIDFPGLVTCITCSAIRSKKVPGCFCGEIATRPTPALVDPKDKLQLFKDSK